MRELWERLGLQARIGLAVGCMLILGLAGGVAFWAYRPDYQVLFADMAPQDAAAVVAELDKLKTPYQLADNGNTILVARDQVYKTRLKVMSKDIPLHGAVGFEIFNNADFGVTDFVQKVNYQRAIQGELTRTILSVDEVASARVHLALPEQGLFKKAAAKPKASVTLTMKPGHALEPAQVSGIQRLVAASVPDIVPADVTVLDQHGVALTRAAGGDAGSDGALAQLDSKRSSEEYVTRKVAQVLDRTFGPGEAIASVDMALNLDEDKVTTDEVLPGRGTSATGSAAGVVVRERHTAHDDPPAAGAGTAAVQGGGVSSAEAEYQVGRRVEQLSVAAGTVKRMTVAVVVKKPLNEEQRAQLREVIALAAGINPARGDAIVVTSLDSLMPGAAPVPASAAPAEGEAQPAVPAAAAARVAANPNRNGGTAVVAVLVALLALACGAAWLRWRGRQVRAMRRLSERERMLLASEVREWVGAGAPAAAERK